MGGFCPIGKCRLVEKNLRRRFLCWPSYVCCALIAPLPEEMRRIETELPDPSGEVRVAAARLPKFEYPQYLGHGEGSGYNRCKHFSRIPSAHVLILAQPF
jgi:hypothetical protein